MFSTYLSFMVCGEFFAVNVAKVPEVLPKQRIVKVPGAPPFVKGVINFRGEVVPVFELRTTFGLPPRPGDDPFVVIIFDLSVGTDGLLIGAIVDKVKDVITIGDDQIKPVPPMSNEFKAEFLQGIVKQQNDFILLLNVEKVFRNEELIAMKETGTETGINNNI